MTRPALAGIHHVKIPVTDLPTSVAWYERVFGFRATIEFPDDDGVARGVGGVIPGLGAAMVAVRENKQAAQGCVGFDPSMGAMHGMPLGGNYSGAKAYVHNFGQALNFELRDTGVNATVLVPGNTRTPGLTERTDIDMSKMPGSAMEVKQVAAIGLKALKRNKPLVIAGAPNRVLDTVTRRLLPRQAGRNLLGKTITRHAPAELTMGP